LRSLVTEVEECISIRKTVTQVAQLYGKLETLAAHSNSDRR